MKNDNGCYLYFLEYALPTPPLGCCFLVFKSKFKDILGMFAKFPDRHSILTFKETTTLSNFT